MKRNITVVLTILILSKVSIAQTDCGDDRVAQSHWRATLETPGGMLPFELIFSSQQSSICKVAIKNGSEVILTDQIILDDSLRIRSSVFNSEIIAALNTDRSSITGFWYDYSRPGNYTLPFNAELVSENKYRFQNMPLPPIANISGTYDAVFTDENGIDSTVGIFKQSGNHLTGTFLTKTGDYRFLEGEVSADSFFLSAFDGSHAFLFKGKIHDEVTLTGHFWSGKHYHATFTAKRNDQAKLPDAKKLTYLKEGYTKIDFRFPDENGKMVSLTDEQFTNKPVILLITGSWCPNCMDEAAYMSQVEETYRNTDLRIVTLQFERQTDPLHFASNMARLRNHFGIEYPMLNAGSNRNAGTALPMLNQVMGFPTTIILDRDHEVVEIHTGFSGPATGDIFLEYQKNFEALLDNLLIK